MPICTECGAEFFDRVVAPNRPGRTKCLRCEPWIATDGYRELTKDEALTGRAKSLAEQAVYQPDDEVRAVPDEALKDMVVEVTEEDVPHLRVLAENSPDPSLRLGAQTILRSKTLARRFEKAGLPPPDAVPPAPGAAQAAGAEIGLKGAAARAESAIDAVSPPPGAAQAASSTGLSKGQLAVVIAIITLLAAGGGAVLMQVSNPLQWGGEGNAAAAPGLTSIKMEGQGGDIHTIPVTVSGNTVSGSATWPATSKSVFEYRASFKGTIEGSAIRGTITLNGRDPNPHPWTKVDLGPWSQSVVMPISGNYAASEWMHADVPLARTGYPITDSGFREPDLYQTLSFPYRLTANLA